MRTGRFEELAAVGTDQMEPAGRIPAGLRVITRRLLGRVALGMLGGFQSRISSMTLSCPSLRSCNHGSFFSHDRVVAANVAATLISTRGRFVSRATYDVDRQARLLEPDRFSAGEQGRLICSRCV